MKPAKFHTVVDIPEFRWKTGYSFCNMFMGSCFTENVGKRMESLKYNVDINPFGILYNPVSVANGLRVLLHEKEFTPEDLVHRDDLWHSFYHHGRFSFQTEHETLNAINNRIKSSAAFLKNAGFLFITFGTAWVYRYNNTGQVVSNCHKIPAPEFSRERLSVNQIVNQYSELLTEIRNLNPSLKVVFTVSPIRHWKDGAVENQRSKAVLLLVADELIKVFGDDYCAYFPAYEIVMDELRDYRFYAEDMLHISDVAVNHIWEKFQQRLIDSESLQVASEVDRIVKAANHRPLHGNSKEYLKFIQRMKEEAIRLENKYEQLNLTKEKESFVTEQGKTEMKR